METAGFDRIITDSHNDWILSYTQTVPSSFCDCDWLISDRVFECIPPIKHHLGVFPSQQDMKCSICMFRGGGGGTWTNFCWVCTAGLPQPVAYTPKFRSLVFWSIFFNVLLSDFQKWIPGLRYHNDNNCICPINKVVCPGRKLWFTFFNTFNYSGSNYDIMQIS